jgi:hypothetical protein
MFKTGRMDFSRKFSIIVSEASINSPEIRSVFIAGELQSNLKEELIDLSI